MGAQQSKSVPITPEAGMHEKAVLERLRSLRVDADDDANDYVHVGDEKNAAATIYDAVSDREPEGLAVEVLESWQSKLLRDPKNRLALSALSAANPKEVLTSRAARIADQQPATFNVRVPLEGAPMTNQRASGRCWLFASTNVFRVALMRRYGVEALELSQAYLFFWDKLEKANFFLEAAIETAAAGEPLDGRLVQRLLADPVSDGGQWDMVVNLVAKYGLVPRALYPDSWNAASSSVLNNVVVARLRGHALALRALVVSGDAAALSAAKARMLREIHLVLVLALGPPPSPDAEFLWEFTDARGRARAVRKTPRDFARDISSPAFRISFDGTSSGGGSSIADHVSLVNDPRHPPLTRLTVDRLGNVVGGRGITYVNVNMATLKAACVAMLRAGIPVFFGSDVGKFSDSASGVMDLDLVDYGLGFNVDLYGDGGAGGGLDKAARLRVGESAMTHAMVLTAVHVEESSSSGSGGGEKTVRWRVQNSWGEAAGHQGWFLMTDRWMDEFVYQAVVDPRFLSREVRDVLTKDPIVLPLWDPMGSLA